ncbi:MAG: DUF2029 domain-containing protein, partial [Cyanobacteria bacterium]|nr:DUF2029 domain-containing protein [Cyanobacteriota bacterium]
WPLCWDFIHYYQCGAMALSTDRFQVYNPEVQLAWTNKLIYPEHVTELWFIQFVPFVFPLMIPFALMPLAQSYVAWNLVSITAGAIPLIQILKKKNWPWLAISGFLIAALVCFPSWFNIWWGQFAWFYLAILATYFLALKKSAHVGAGICLALLSIKPQYIFPMAMPALALRRWQTIAVAVAAELVLLAIAGFTIGWDAVLHYPQTLFSAEKQAGQMQANAGAMISLRGIFSVLLPSNIALYASMFLYFAVLPLLWIIWRRDEKATESDYDWPIALTVLTAILFSPHSMVYDCLIIMLAGALTLPGYKISQLVFKAGRMPALPGRAWILLIYFYPILSWLMFLPFGDNETKPFARIYAGFDAILLIAGLLTFFRQSAKSDISDRSV